MVKYLLVAILLVVTLFMALLAWYSLGRRQKTVGAKSLGWLLAAIAIYSGFYAFELNSSSLEAMLFWNRLEYIGISFIPLLWILFTARYADMRWVPNRPVMILLFLVSLVTLFGAFSDPYLHLRYTTVFVLNAGPFPVLGFTRGPLYWSHVTFTLISITFSTVLLFIRLLSTAAGLFRYQQFLMICGTLIPYGNYLLYLFGVNFWGVDTVPFSMFLSVVCFGIAIFGYRILDVVPVARDIVFETMSDGVIVLSTSNQIVDYNAAASAVFPQLTRHVLSHNVLKILAAHRTFCEQLEKGGSGDFQFMTGSGEDLRYFQSSLSVIQRKGGEAAGKIILFKDNTDSTLLLEKLQELATIDPLTRVFNRRHFIELANRQLDYLARVSRSLTITILDLDHFKRINDTFGHLAGDEILRSVARVLSTGLRPCDFVARFGGEEFICFLSETSGSSAFDVVERLRMSISRIRVLIPPQTEITITASFGIHCVEALGNNVKIDQLIACADTALYRAKEEGRNRSVVY